MRKRPLCIATVFFVCGIITGLYIQIGIALFLLLGFVIYKIFHNSKCILFILIFMLGITIIKSNENHYKQIYDSIDTNEKYHIQAVVVSDADEKQYKSVYEIEVKKIGDEEKYKGEKWLLQLKESKLQYGDLIDFYGTIEIPQGARNYKGFDYQKYLKSKRIYGTITEKNKLTIVSKNKTNFLQKAFYIVRKDIKNRIYKLLPEDTKEVCFGILTGSRDDISSDITEAFKNSNLTHMLAVSGAHISYLITGLSFLLSKTGKKFRKITTIVFLIFFMGLTRFTPSVQRASFTSILLLIASLIHRKSDSYTSLAFSLLIMLIYNPYSIFDIGLQLSYGGTIGIILFQSKISKWLYTKFNLQNKSDKKSLIKYIIDMLTVSISANIVIIPIMIVQFNNLSLTFWISNILAGPLLGFIIILGFLTYLISIISMKVAVIPAFLLKNIINIFIFIAEICSKLPFSSITVITPSTFEILLYYIAVFAMFNLEKVKEIAKKHKPKKIVIITLIFILIVVNVVTSINRPLRVYFIDVGQGDSTLICTPNNKTILIDGGGSENSTSFDVGKQILLPYLLDRRINKIDYMMISHFDSDHVGGLLYVLDKIKVRHVIIAKQGQISSNYEQFKKIIKKKKIDVIVAKGGDKIQISKDIYFDILFPENNLIKENVLNNNSILAKFCYKDFSMLFTGDIEKIAEEQIVDLYKNTNILNSTILKVAHHGSKTSSIEQILDKIKPKIALIGVRK